MIENPRIAQIFEEIADCLEIQGDNPFRVRAYQNAARVIRELPQQAADVAESLEELPGIGKDLAGKIRVILRTGDLPMHLSLCRRLPAGLRGLMEIPGLGPKRTLILNKKLGINSVDALQKAALEGRLRRLRGFGEKTEASILRGLESLEKSGKRFLISNAKTYADDIVAHMQAGPGLGAVEAAGSYRRRRETVGDLDILATCADANVAMARFAAYGAIEHVLASGPTKMSVRLKNGMQVDLRVVPEESFGSALQYFTGSQAHNIQLRARAQARGLRLNEYGVYRGRRRLAGRREEEVYAALDLPWIAPELREGRGEIELARAARLPKLIETSDIRGDLHMHTTATDGRNNLDEMVAAAKARGYAYIAITEHSKRVAMAHGLDDERIKKHWKKIDAIAAATTGMAVLKGVEVDILDDGSLDLSDDVLKEADWVVASLHYGQRQPREQITRRLLAAIKNPRVSAIGHPTGRLISRRPPQDADLDAVFRAAADYGCALELNGQPNRLDLNDRNAAAAKTNGIPIVIDSDAHSIHELDNMEYGVFQARRAGLSAANVINTRELTDFRGLKRPFQ